MLNKKKKVETRTQFLRKHAKGRKTEFKEVAISDNNECSSIKRT